MEKWDGERVKNEIEEESRTKMKREVINEVEEGMKIEMKEECWMKWKEEE
jgi:hypothetical protein